MHVGVAGTGKMGSAIARNLLDRGYRISVWNVDREMMEPLVAAGAAPFESLERLVASVDATIAMLWDDDVAREISLRRIIPAARKGALFIETVYAFAADVRDARRGRGAATAWTFSRAPVLGSVDGARTGTLTLLPGGSSRGLRPRA